VEPEAADFYTTQSPITDPGAMEHRLSSLPKDVAACSASSAIS
jgi:hypothetical protein